MEGQQAAEGVRAALAVAALHQTPNRRVKMGGGSLETEIRTMSLKQALNKYHSSHTAQWLKPRVPVTLHQEQL